jgi:hypothetical protein
MSTKKEKCRCCDGECNHDACCGKIEENCATNCPCHQSESIEWEKDNKITDLIQRYAHRKGRRNLDRRIYFPVKAITTAVAKAGKKAYAEGFEDGCKAH